MTDAEKNFKHKLEVFEKDVEKGIKFFYVYLTINYLIGRNKKVRDKVYETPRFWFTNIDALRQSFFITLGRIFDTTSPHNIASILKLAKKNKEIFSKKALAERKRQGSPNADEWLNGYLVGVYEPTDKDFQRLERYIQKYRNIYNDNYKKIRDKIYAHTEYTKPRDIETLFKKTNIPELEKLTAFLSKLNFTLW